MKTARAVARIKKGEEEVIEIGNIDVIKEYNYAGDMMEAIWLLVNQNIIFETVIGSGKGYAIKEWLSICFKFIGKDWKHYVEVKNGYEPEFMRLVSNPGTIFSLGWKPKIGIEKLAEMMMNEPL